MKRNVVLVTIDSLRADHCGFMGYDRDTTPTLDRMAEDGVTFANAISPGPKTPESLPVLFTGSHMINHVGSSDLDSWGDVIKPHMLARDTIPERFSRHGYETAGFTPNGFTSRFFHFDQGFDHFEDFIDDELRPGLETSNVLRALIKWVRNEGNWKLWEDYYDEVVSVTESLEEPFFLWVFLLDVHSPYLVPRAYRTDNSWLSMMYANWNLSDEGVSESNHRRLVSAYDDTIRYVDSFLDRLLADLSPYDPVYAVHSDHGEAFGEHGTYGHGPYLYRENIEIPFVLSNVTDSREIETPVSLIQLPDILVDAATTSAQDVRFGDANGLAIARSGQGNQISVQSQRFKLLEESGTRTLFDLVDDPEEAVDRSDDRPEVREHLETALDLHQYTGAEKSKITSEVGRLAESHKL